MAPDQEHVRRQGPIRLSRKALRTAEPAISRLIEMALRHEGLISLAPGLVDEETLPVAETLAACHEVLADAHLGRRALQYGTTQGLPELRELLAAHLEQLDRTSGATQQYDPARIVVGTGSQQLLYLIAQTLLDPDDIVLTTAPDYFVYVATLESAGAELWGVPMDEHGVIPEALDELLRYLDRQGDLWRVKFLYCVSYYHNPTGVCTAAERRAAILETLERWSRYGPILLLEDAAYRELGEDDVPPAPSFVSYDDSNQRVILCQTFSKPFAPGLKCGYAYLPEDLVEPILREKSNHDFGSANLVQYLIATLLRSGAYHRQAALLRRQYSQKRRRLIGALERYCDEYQVTLRWTKPSGGLYVWLIAPPELDTRSAAGLFHRCVANGVLYVPGEYCFLGIRALQPDTPLGSARNTLRLAYGHCPTEQLEEGVRRLVASIAEELAHASSQQAHGSS